MTEAVTDFPATTEQALSLVKEKLGGKTPPSNQPPAAEPVEQPDQAQAAADDGVEAKAPEASPAPKKAEYTFVADPVLRAALEANPLPDEAVKSFKGWMADYTQKAQKASEYEKKATAFDDLISIPGAQEAIASLLARADKPPEPQAEEIPDFSQMESKDILAVIRREAQKIAEGMVAERVQKPVARIQGVLNTARSMFTEWQDKVPEAVYKATWDECVKEFGEDAFTPENTKVLFTPYLKAAAARQELEALKGAKAKSAEVAKRATSPAGTSTSAPRLSEPKVAPGDREAIRARTKAQVMEMLGLSERDLDDASR